ncbi:MAG: hypothetical protein OXM55_04885 [Bdellovibrionales bacterium]|nr:hypothetical protein [Bdellovibrionales bacterium]
MSVSVNPALYPSSKANRISSFSSVMEDEDIAHLDKIKNILDVDESQYPSFVLAKNKARFRKKLSWYKSKKDWLDVAPIYKVNKLFKQQSKELEVIRSNKLDYEMELETCSLTPSQRSHRKDELKMCKIHEKMAIQLITKMQFKFKLCR